jgi:hypothetical protein
MAKSKITSNGEKNQEAVAKQPIKHFQSGVVSWSLFSDFYDCQTLFVSRINFLIDAGFGTQKFSSAAGCMEDLVRQARGDFNEIWEKAKAEKREAGGNFVSTIKDITDTSERKFMAELVGKAKKELQEIDA